MICDYDAVAWRDFFPSIDVSMDTGKLQWQSCEKRYTLATPRESWYEQCAKNGSQDAHYENDPGINAKQQVADNL